jgi:uncharacterized protein (TIGR02271 family)
LARSRVGKYHFVASRTRSSAEQDAAQAAEEACMDRNSEERAGRREPGREDLHHNEGREEELRGREDLRDEDELRVQRSEEELRTGTREREAGRVGVRKQVRTDREQVSVPTRHEEVSVERVPVNEEGTGAEIGEDEVSVPVVEDEVVVEKRPVVKEEIRVRKDAVEDEELVEEDVRKEEVDVEDRTERLGGRAEEGRRGEGQTDRTTGESERPAEQSGREGTGEEGFLDKAKRKLEGR